MDQDSATPGVQDKKYTEAEFKAQVDLSMWDSAVYCGSCHVGGGFVEKDRNGVRYSQRQPDAGGLFDAYLFYVNDTYDPLTGMPTEKVAMAPWIYPQYADNNPANGPVLAPNGWGRAAMSQPGMPISDGQLMMPNVKEMDCLYCHFEGYDNLMHSVMNYSGALNVTATVGAGLMDTNKMSPTYQGYNVSLVDVDQNGIVSLNSTALSRIKANPPADNCRKCHMPTSLTDLPSMMKDFLSSAPMIYTGNFSASMTGLEMPAFDFNAPFGFTWNFSQGPYGISPVVNVTNISSYMIAAIGYPAAMGQTIYNSMPGFGGTVINPMIGEIGGGNKAGTGPLYYEKLVFDESGNPVMMGMAPAMDQNSLKKGIVPFPRAEWFKRGDLWDNRDQEVHIGMECAGCHMDTDTLKVDGPGKDGKSLCDPGRGYDSASGVETSTALGIDSRNTIKKCADCHVTGKNSDGVAIDTFNAPNPTSAHAMFNLTAPMVNAVRMKADGTGEETFLGSHMDIIDCAVCHTYKKQMVVRALDSTSGNRYPNMLGFDTSKGMLGMFNEPMPGMTNEGVEWKPLYTWAKIGDGDKILPDGSANPNWRRKVYPINIITAVLWNNIDPSVDANGDGVTGRPAAPNLTYYDPWISRDMKAGVNYGPSGFAPVPVGFGNGAFQSAYNPDGTFTGAWNYVGVYGGNAVFSTPEEIENYKAFRNTIAPAVDGKSWSGTQLLLLGGPYMITHNVRSTANFVLGKSCGDCHAAGKGFFDGGFNMTGTAIKANAGASFMQSPAEILQIVAKAEDLETGAELATKSGAAREVKFEEHGDWNPATKTFTPNPVGEYKKAIDLSRSEALYPDEGTFTAADGTVYPNRAAYVAYLTGIGAAPTADIATVGSNNTAGLPTTAEVTVTQGTVTLAATAAGPLAADKYSYAWTCSDSNVTLSGQSVTRAFSATGTYTLTLRVKNLSTNEEKVDQIKVKVTAPAPAAGVAVAAAGISYNSPSAGYAIIPLTITGVTFNKVKVVWGDGNTNIYTTSDANFVLPSHKFWGYPAKKSFTAKVYVYNGTTLTAQNDNITVLFP
ncbi:PKD domain-containing protein [Geobacter sulfurreducens]|uniref:PKD domain-containing protein n=1 Tax=Geobacter sulfurreducens TaxID=35554 RepID=UPI000DBB3471|nr:PKD domain-containing protein [Geobacter sulfurreducens]BBA71629.1 C-type multiheme cytochrome [Geobacter sulfurreducens]